MRSGKLLPLSLLVETRRWIGDPRLAEVIVPWQTAGL